MRLEYEKSKPILKCEKHGVEMTIEFSEKEPEENTKERVLDILITQYQNKAMTKPCENL